MISKMREYTKIFVIIVALAFIGLLVFEWGMDYSGSSNRSTIIGSVNGEELSYQEWQQLYSQLINAEKQRSQGELDEERLLAVRGQVWDQFVQRILFSEEMDRLDIAVSDSEIVYQIRNYPLEELKNNPAFQTDGVFDWNKYYASFTNPNVPWYDIEMMYRQNLPFQKLQNLISSTVRVSESEIEDAYFRENVKAKVSYLGIPFARFTSQVVDVEEEEVNEYYQDHISEFQREEMRDLAYVHFKQIPSSQDTARLLTQFEDIRQRYTDGEDFNKMADMESDDPAAQNNHGRYDYFERGAMVKEFEEASFEGKPGDLVGPVQTQFGYHLILIEDKRIHEGLEQVKVSHILKEIRPGIKTREDSENNAYALNELAKIIGFQAAVDSLKLTALPLNNITKNMQSIPGFGKNSQIQSFAFKTLKEDVPSDIIFINSGYTVFTVTRITKAGPTPLVEVRPLVESRIRLEKAQKLAGLYAKSVTPQIDQGIPFTAIAEADTASPRILRSGETDFITLTSNVPGIGVENKFNATAVSLKEPQEISTMIETRSGLYWLKLIDSIPFDSTAYSYQKDTILRRIRAQKSNMIFASWFSYLKDRASIEDNRRDFDLD
jgi:peptidyl-prolyl cis-trans isomerase D